MNEYEQGDTLTVVLVPSRAGSLLPIIAKTNEGKVILFSEEDPIVKNAKPYMKAKIRVMWPGERFITARIVELEAETPEVEAPETPKLAVRKIQTKTELKPVRKVGRPRKPKVEVLVHKPVLTPVKIGDIETPMSGAKVSAYKLPDKYFVQHSTGTKSAYISEAKYHTAHEVLEFLVKKGTVKSNTANQLLQEMLGVQKSVAWGAILISAAEKHVRLERKPGVSGTFLLPPELTEKSSPR